MLRSLNLPDVLIIAGEYALHQYWLGFDKSNNMYFEVTALLFEKQNCNAGKIGNSKVSLLSEDAAQLLVEELLVIFGLNRNWGSYIINPTLFSLWVSVLMSCLDVKGLGSADLEFSTSWGETTFNRPDNGRFSNTTIRWKEERQWKQTKYQSFWK